jgi:hypothetical protein
LGRLFGGFSSIYRDAHLFVLDAGKARVLDVPETAKEQPATEKTNDDKQKEEYA